jgi:hypothetical protein
MTSAEAAEPNWPAYLEVVRDDVLEGIGVFAEDDQLRALFRECFERGDALSGTVLWSEGRGPSVSD